MTEYAFKKFEGRNKRLEDRITVTKSKSIGLPTKFYNDNKIKDYRYAIIFWDKGNQAIGINFTNDENEKSKFSIAHSQSKYGGNIILRSFFKSNDIDTDKFYGRYEWEITNIEGVGKIYVIKLKQHVNGKGGLTE